MSSLIPEIAWEALKRIVEAGKIRELKSCEVKLDGGYILTAIIPHGGAGTEDYARIQAEYLGVKANIPGGKDPEELLGELPEKLTLYEKRVAAMAHARKAKKLKQLVEV